MAVDFDFGKDFFNFAFGINHKRGALDSEKRISVEEFFLINAVGLSHGFIGIRKQWKWKFVFRDEFFVGIDVIETDAINFSAFGLKLFPQGAEITGFFRAARCVVFGIKIKDDRFAFQTFKANRSSVT